MGERWGLVVAGGLAIFVAQLDATIVNVALPTIANDASVAQWVVLGYLTPIIGLALCAGRWVDVSDPRRVLRVACGGFALASVACGLAPGIGWSGPAHGRGDGRVRFGCVVRNDRSAERHKGESNGMSDFNTAIIEEFRANGGKVGGPFEGSALLLLTTRGARSGAPHTIPLGYLDDGDRFVVVASAAGAPNNPAWFHNAQANPEVTVELGTTTFQAKATVPPRQERDTLWSKVIEAMPGYADYQKQTDRLIPVVVLTRD